MRPMFRAIKWIGLLFAAMLLLGVLTGAACDAIEGLTRPPGQPDDPIGGGDEDPPLGQLVTNQGFEQPPAAPGEPPPHWTRDDRATGQKGDVRIDARPGDTGDAVLRLSPNARNDESQPLAVFQMIDAPDIEGRTLEFSAEARSSDGATALLGLMAIVNGAPSGIEFAPPATTAEWTRVAGEFRVPEGGEVRIAVICAVNGESGSAWFDGVRVGSAQQAGTTAEGDEELRAAVRVDASRIVREIPRRMFGTNIEWRWHGNFVWDEKADRLDPEMIRLTREMGVTLIRYPGGVYADNYHWRQGVGPREERPIVQHEPGVDERSRPTFGTDEVLEFADRVGAEVMITVNAGSGTAREAADWVRYVNRDELRVELWEVGNELYINNDSVFTSAVTVDPETYADRYLEFAEAMRAADPRIKIGAIGGENQGRYRILSYPDWNEIVLRRAGDEIDFLSVHNAYAPVLDRDPEDMRAVYRSMMGAPENTESNLRTLSGQLDRYLSGGRDPFIAVTEWGPFFRPGWDSPYIDHHKTLGSTIFAASMFKTLLESERTELAAFWHLSDVSVLGWIGSTNDEFPADPTWARTAKYKMFRLYSEHFGERIVQTATDSPTFTTPSIGYTSGVDNTPYVEAISSISADGASFYVMLINRSFERSAVTEISVSGFQPESRAVARTLTGTSLDAHTGTVVVDVPGLGLARQKQDPDNPRFYEGGPEEIIVETETIEVGSAFEVTLPRLSVTSLELRRRR